MCKLSKAGGSKSKANGIWNTEQLSCLHCYYSLVSCVYVF